MFLLDHSRRNNDHWVGKIILIDNDYILEPRNYVFDVKW